MNSQRFKRFGLALVVLLGLANVLIGQGAKQQYPDMSALKVGSNAKAVKPSPVVTAEGYYDNLELAKASPAKVVRLNLQNHNLKSIPADLCLFPNLQELDLSHNQIKSLEVGFTCPTALKRLYVNHNEITELPAKLAQLTQLQVLVAYDNPVAKIDPAIGTMRNLKELWLSGNGTIASMQPAIWNLQGLETLRLWNFGLTQIPDAIAQMQHLTTLCFQHNQLQALNPKVCDLPALNYLNLGDNKVTRLPAEIRQCTRLGYLGIYENPFTVFPDDFSVLSKTLERISAWKTGLSASEQNRIKENFPKTALMFEAIDLH
ncbi:MAG: hypothetical protein RLZZ519_378 [Bacteroidota bacterium]|jgi:Leucine-rich repeat (LRR) protein